MGKRWAIASLAAVVLAGGVAVAVAVALGDSETFECADVGLRGPSAATPEGALDAVLRPQDGRLSDWKRADRRTVDRPTREGTYEVIDFVPRQTTVFPAYSLVSVSTRFAGWRADGACVARPPRQ